jgi:ABC-type transport system involved in multi-copper enzyme maturation permease subunit
MNATTVDAFEHTTRHRSAGRLLGLRNLVRKDFLDWRHGNRTWIVALATTTVVILGAANAAINQWVLNSFPAEAADGAADTLSVVPIDNLLVGIGTQIGVLAVIFATMSLLIAERDSGTLAWTISKPVSRTSVLVSKWLTAALVLWVAAFVVPLAVTTGLVTILYGAPDMAVVVALGVAIATVPAIFVGVTLVASTFVSNQAAVGAIAIVLFILPSIAGGIVPAVAPFFPTSIFGWAIEVSTGGPISLVTPAAWAVGMAVLFVLGRRRLADMDL